MMPADMPIRILALDTATPHGSVALLEGREVCAELRLFSLETHSQRLLGTIEYLLQVTGWGLDEVGLVAAGIGPGSFTGIRIGVATALGLAQGKGIPFAAVSGMDATAHGAATTDGRLGVVIDARRSQVYYAEYAV
ncbi:MAG: tRNA (adenosine(37)-N6)-threonylcarbamoyltransferase complex dimerization subunit type 1 TsaB, partial [Acidobacteria bacterium]|nr:tRNA (adenosine(37)-N6)-threonylcarbamoyltransferase complex dimerization subunit type 1 TsaB [Acidobacteriota bacterium]